MKRGTWDVVRASITRLSGDDCPYSEAAFPLPYSGGVLSFRCRFDVVAMGIGDTFAVGTAVRRRGNVYLHYRAEYVLATGAFCGSTVSVSGVSVAASRHVCT